MIDLTVKTLDSKNHAFTVPDVITVKQLKERIASSVKISADSQRLIYCGRVLQDEKLLSEYDVNGKVIHLVQRAPPVNNSGGPDRGPAGARSATGASGPRRHWRELFGPGGNSGNAMYLGAMAFPAEIMDASGISMQQPRQCLSQSRLAVVRNMLSRASTILNRLENPPQESSETSPENGSTPPETNNEEDIASGGASIATLEISPGSFIIDNQQIDVGGPSVEIQTEAGSEANRATTAAAASEADTASTNDQPAQNDNGDSSNNETSRYPRTQVLAELLDQVAEVNSRMQPFMTQYQQLMRDDPTFSEQTDVTANQRLFRSVSEIMHDLAHAYHALSDIMCDFSQPPPRSLRCRPVLIHHSAVVQAGIPIQVSGTLSGGNGSQQQSASASSGNSNSNETTNRPAAGTTATATTTPATAAAAAATTASAAAAFETASVTAEEPPAANGTEQTSRQARPAATTRIGPVGASGPGFEFFVDVAPGSITIDSVEATVVTNGNQSTAEPNNWQNPPEFVQNLITALAGQFMGATLQQYRFSDQQPSGTNSPHNYSAVSSSSNSDQVSNSTSSATAAATASSQARGNTATHPTTATQTRSTARPATTPHVHLSPTSLQGLRTNNFDPFLPCNSHHIRSNRTGRQRSASQPSGGINSSPEAPRVVPIPTPSISISLRADPVISVEQQPSRSGPSQQTPLTLPPELQALIQSFRNVPNVSSEQIYPQQLAQLLQTIQGGQGNATLAQLLQNLPGYSYTSGESIFTDVFMPLAESLSFMDMVQLGLGSSECLVRARPRLQRFVTQRLLNNQPLTLSAITQIIDRFNNEIRPYFSVLSNARLREEVDLPASINLYNHSMLPCIINTVMEEDQSTFHRTLMRKCAQYVRQLSALLQYCCLDGVTGLESILRSFVDQMTTGVGGVLQEWTMSHSIINFRTFISTQNVSTDEIKRFLVYRMCDPATGASPQPASTPPIVPPAAESMDIQETEESQIESTPSLLREPPLADVAPAQHINEVIGWQNAIPSEWVPIITRDSQRQRRQNSQGPFSDAYLSGMPSKRRKLITSTKPQGNLSQVISESMATALGAAGMSSGPEVDVIAQRAGQDSTLRAAYREQVRTTLRHNLSSNQDYTPEKYPNSAKYFKK